MYWELLWWLLFWVVSYPLWHFNFLCGLAKAQVPEVIPVRLASNALVLCVSILPNWLRASFLFLQENFMLSALVMWSLEVYWPSLQTWLQTFGLNKRISRRSSWLVEGCLRSFTYSVPAVDGCTSQVAGTFSVKALLRKNVLGLVKKNNNNNKGS